MKKKYKLLFISIWTFIALIIIVGLIVQLPIVQKIIINKIANKISNEQGLKISIEKVKLSLPINLIFENITIKNLQNEEVVKVLETKIILSAWLNDFSIPNIKNISLNGVTLDIIKKNDKWNFENNNQTQINNNSNINLKLLNILFSNTNIFIKDSTNTSIIKLKNFATAISIKDNIFNLHDFTLSDFYINLKTKKSITNTDTLKNSKIYIDSLKKKFISAINYIHKLPIKIDFNNFNFNNGKIYLNINNESILIENLNIKLNNIFKDSSIFKSNIIANALLRNTPIKLGVNFELLNNKFNIKKLSLTTNNNDININSNIVWNNNNKNKLFDAKLNFNKSIIDINEIFKLLNINKFFPEKIIAQSEILYNNDSLKIVNLDITKNTTSLIKINKIIAYNFDNIDSLNINTENLSLNLDSNQLIYYSKLFKLDTIKYNNILNSFKFFKYEGNFKFINLKANLIGLINSNYGNIDENISINFKNKEKDIYDWNGNISVENINLSYLFKDIPINNLNAQIKFNGIKNKKSIYFLESKINIDSLKIINNYYKKLNIELSYFDNILNTSIKSNDYKCNFFSDIITNFKDTNNIKINLNLIVNKLELDFWKKNNFYKGEIKANIEYLKNNNKLINNVSFINNYLFNELEKNEIEKFNIDYEIQNNNHQFNIYFNNIGYIKLNGIQNFKNLQFFFFNQLPKYFTKNYINKPNNLENIYNNKNIKLDIKLNNLSKYKNLFSNNIKEINEIINSSFYDENNKYFSFYLYIDKFENDLFKIKNFDLKFKIDKKTEYIDFDLNIDTTNILNIDYINKLSTKFKFEKNYGFLLINSDNKNNWINIYTTITKNNSDQFFVNILKYNLKFFNQLWTIKNDAKIILSSNELIFENIEINNNKQKVFFKTQDYFGDKHLIIKTENIQLENIVALFTKDINIKALINTNFDINYNDLDNTISSISANGILQNTILNSDTLGDININTITSKNKFIYKIKTKHKINDIFITNENLIDSQQFCKIEINNVDLHVLKPYLIDVFNVVEGRGNGMLFLKLNNDNKFEWDGYINLNYATLNVIYSNCKYEIQPQRVIFKKNLIKFYDFSFKDIENNTGNINGEVNLDFNDFNNFYYKFNIYGKDINGYNTTIKDNDIYYGNINGDINLLTKGTLKGDSVYITLIPNSISKFYFNAGLNKNVKSFDEFITFKQNNYFEEKIKIPKQSISNRKFLLDLRIKNPLKKSINFNLILNKVNNEVIESLSQPELNIYYDDIEGFKLNGNVYIIEGKYDFSFNISGINLKRKFLIDNTKKNYINWSGDPKTGEINIYTKYVATKVNTSSLGVNVENDLNQALSTQYISSPTTSSTDSKKTQSGGLSYILTDIDVSAILLGQINNFDINFDINFSSNSEILTNPMYNIYSSYLKNIKSNKNELFKQATYLIMFSSFSATQNTQNANIANSNPNIINNISTEAYNSISNAIASYLSSFSNNLLNSKTIELEFNSNVYNTYELGENAISTKSIRSQFGLGFKKLFNEKLILKTDFNLDLPIANNNSSSIYGPYSNYILPNVNLEYRIINSNGIKLNWNLFWKNFYDNFIKGAKSKAGTSFSINKEFDKEIKK